MSSRSRRRRRRRRADREQVERAPVTVRAARGGGRRQGEGRDAAQPQEARAPTAKKRARSWRATIDDDETRISTTTTTTRRRNRSGRDESEPGPRQGRAPREAALHRQGRRRQVVRVRAAAGHLDPVQGRRPRCGSEVDRRARAARAEGRGLRSQNQRAGPADRALDHECRERCRAARDAAHHGRGDAHGGAVRSREAPGAPRCARSLPGSGVPQGRRGPAELAEQEKEREATEQQQLETKRTEFWQGVGNEIRTEIAKTEHLTDDDAMEVATRFHAGLHARTSRSSRSSSSPPALPRPRPRARRTSTRSPTSPRRTSAASSAAWTRSSPRSARARSPRARRKPGSKAASAEAAADAHNKKLDDKLEQRRRSPRLQAAARSRGSAAPAPRPPPEAAHVRAAHGRAFGMLRGGARLTSSIPLRTPLMKFVRAVHSS
jgi:hypothetical protein